MIKIYFIKLSNLIIYLVSRILIFFITFRKQQRSKNTLLLIRLDLIGDYILFRNFLPILKQHYKGYKVVLCGNVIWKDLSELLDSTFIDEYIWINRKKFYGNIFYKTRILNKIFRWGFNTVINPVFTREILYGDMMVLASKAEHRIGSTGSPDKHAHWKRNLLTDKFYTKLISADDENTFEFLRNKEFVQKLLNEKIEIKKPSLPKMISSVASDKDFIVFVVGASEANRQWKVTYFIKAAEYILMNSNLDIILTGASADKDLADDFLKGLTNYISRVSDFTGKTTLPEFVELIAQSEFLISNETSAVHIAAALCKPFICISNGNHFGRFNPYPKEMIKDSYYVYPDEITNRLNEPDELIRLYKFGSNLNVNSITTDKVIRVIMSIFVQHNLHK